MTTRSALNLSVCSSEIVCCEDWLARLEVKMDMRGANDCRAAS
jgi:hypothetical protein